MKAPNFKLPSTSGIFQLSDYLGKNIILYFYPRDNTKGCSLEAIDFNNSLKTINKYNCIVVGVSKDSIESHQKFKKKNTIKIKYHCKIDIFSSYFFYIFRYFSIISFPVSNIVLIQASKLTR